MVLVKIKRLIFNKLSSQISEPKISILIGPRQVGKTFLLKEIEIEAQKQGYTITEIEAMKIIVKRYKSK